MDITQEIFRSALLCSYKAYLFLRGEKGVKSEYETFFTKTSDEYCTEAFKRFNVSEKTFENICGQSKSQESVLYRTHISGNGMSTNCVIGPVKGGSALGAFHYEPVMCSANEKISNEDCMSLAYEGLVLESIQSRRPEFGRVIHGDSSKKVRIVDQMEKARKIVASIKKFDSNPPRLILNRHCHICEFSSVCRAKVIEKDDLSLLAGISPKEIEAQNKRGIFTVTQYSYTFRPRKKFRKSYPFNLKALALREKKIHLYGTPTLPMASVQIYLDVEGDPDRNFYYLIGMVIIENGIEKKYTFWADSESQEGEVCLAFVNCLRPYSDFKIYHYGSYESKFLEKVRAYVDSQKDLPLIERIIDNAVNILSIIYGHVFFPTYSNGLKDIGSYLGFKWTSEDASGINSLVWRAKFERQMDGFWKDKLTTYNQEDCLSLKEIVGVLYKIISGAANKSDKQQVDYVCVDQLKRHSTYKWGTVDFLLKDFDYVNNCAYFDYQREKIFVRTYKNLGRIKSIQRIKKNNRFRINQKIVLKCPRKCPICKNQMYRHGKYFRRVLDLKFLDAGMKRWVTIYYKNRARCVKCKKVARPEYPKGLQKYGHNLISWVIYQHIVGHQPFYRIISMLEDLFGFYVSGSTLQRFKKIASEYYQRSYQKILERIKKGNLVHVDETQVFFSSLSGYVWVFTNMEEVYFHYAPSREGEFLKEWLKKFRGVLISDFYGAYSAPEWIQQKCLVHLIRDMNDDMRQNPFDAEYKEMVVQFSLLLRQIIGTVDKHGLKKRNLGKHKIDVRRYFKNIFSQNYTSELAQKYQKRLKKNEDTLFTFLDYDGVPWNNNNAEHAIKHLALYRQTMKNSGRITERGFKQYLILLSIYQTCQYRGINFLKFLVSKEKDIDRFSQNRSRKSSFIPEDINTASLCQSK